MEQAGAQARASKWLCVVDSVECALQVASLAEGGVTEGMSVSVRCLAVHSVRAITLSHT